VPEFPLADWEAMFAEMASALGMPVDAFRRGWRGTIVERQTGGFRTVEENVRAICERAGVEPSAEGLARALEARHRRYVRGFRPRPDAVPTLTWLRERGYRTALVSMCAPDAPAFWHASPLAGLVEVLVFSCEVGLRKPDAAIYLAAAERLGVEPSACLYVGDGSYRELTGAQAVGMHPVRIVDPAETGEVLRPEPDDWQGPTISSLDELRRLLEPEAWVRRGRGRARARMG
jgi:HAD superfamily hydrolase (TIGR01509 family)